jgi:predicted ester cyclase
MEREAPMSTEENKAIIRRYLEEAWDRGNLTIIDELMSPDYARYLSGQPPLNRESQKQRIASFRQGLPDVRLTLEDLVAEGDRVVFRITLRGTQQGALMGVPPTGKSVTIGAIDIARLEGGKIVEHWGQMDTYGLLQQLGAAGA